MIRRWNLPLTYEPKIEPVLDGRCTQTIRAGRKIKVGDLVSFHGWSGRPYRSPWSFGKPPRYWEVKIVFDIMIFRWGIKTPGNKYCWENWELGNVSALDFILPPTGEELGKVLLSMHKIPEEGLLAQIIRWRYS